MGYFDYRSAAERYAQGRPYFHPLVIDKIRTYLSLDDPLPWAIDVGCGTGLSSQALTAIAKRVVAIDPSIGMLAQATRHTQITYAAASAYAMPVPSGRFGLMTLSCVFHWLDRAAFFAEARRVLCPGGWLVLYDNGFTGRMAGVDAFREWATEVYLKRYPSPPRDRSPFEAEDARKEGFRYAHREVYENTIRFNREQMVHYLITQSNIITAVEGGSESLADIDRWLHGQLAPFLPDGSEGAFIFRGPITYLQRV